jgi:hypothetical protein
MPYRKTNVRDIGGPQWPEVLCFVPCKATLWRPASFGPIMAFNSKSHGIRPYMSRRRNSELLQKISMRWRTLPFAIRWLGIRAFDEQEQKWFCTKVMRWYVKKVSRYPPYQSRSRLTILIYETRNRETNSRRRKSYLLNFIKLSPTSIISYSLSIFWTTMRQTSGRILWPLVNILVLMIT